MDDFSFRTHVERILDEREKRFAQYTAAQALELSHLKDVNQQVIDKLNILENRITQTESMAMGKKDVWGYILAIIGFGIAAAIAVFNRFGWPHN